MNIGIKKNTFYYRESEKACSAPVRMYEKDGKDNKSYFEGWLDLSNGQKICISTGGRLIVNKDKKGRSYLTAKVVFTTGNVSHSKRSNFN